MHFGKNYRDTVSGGVVYYNTEQYLLNRRKKIQKVGVDRRASKARKLQYKVYEKLVNYMAPLENEESIPNREEFIMNLFSQNKQEVEFDNNIEMDVPLI